MSRKLFKKERAADWARRYNPALKVRNSIEFAHSKRKPKISFHDDEPMYFSPSENEIHLGVYGIVNVFQVADGDEEDLWAAAEYARGHETQHVLSTASRPYGAAIEAGEHAVIAWMAEKVTGKPVRIRKPEDYKAWADVELPRHGIHVSMRALEQQCAWLANSLEDGRIERIRSSRYEGFKAARLTYRFRFWDRDVEWPSVDVLEKDPVEKLSVLCNDILVLATCQKHAKGFPKAYDGTPIMEEMEQFIEPIAKAISSGKTRGLVEPMKEICGKLAPYLYEACKASATDAAMKAALEKAIADMLKGMLDSLPDGGGCLEDDEDTDDGGFESAFPHSDLVVTLDDETYDKLMEKMKPGKSSGGGITVRREHPKEEEKKEDADGSGDGSGSGSSSGGESKDGKGSGESSGSDGAPKDGSGEGGNGSSGKPEDGKPSGEKNGSGNGGTDDTGKNEAGNGGSGKPEARDGSSTESASDGNEAKGGGESASSEADSLKDGGSMDSSGNSNPTKPGSSNMVGEVSQDKGSGKNFTESGEYSKSEEDAAMEEIRKAAKEAAEKTHAEAADMIDSGAMAAAHERKTAPKEIEDTTKPLSTGEIMNGFDDNEKRGMHGFEETKREYKLTDNLPPVSLAHGKTLRRRTERYFKSISTPNVTNLDSGSVDPSLITSLGYGNTEIFRKKGKDKKFDGCAYVLIDNSGSMAGNKRIEACRAAAIIEEGFRGIMPFKIVAFDWYYKVIHEVVKGWDESKNKSCCWNFALHGRQGCGNADGYDIKIATRELLARPERKKMLIVLSDGAPTEASESYTKAQIDAARKAGVKVCGIYFEEGYTGGDGEYGDAKVFRNMYQRDYVMCDPKEIAANLVKIFKKFAK